MEVSVYHPFILNRLCLKTGSVVVNVEVDHDNPVHGLFQFPTPLAPSGVGRFSPLWDGETLETLVIMIGQM